MNRSIGIKAHDTNVEVVLRNLLNFGLQAGIAVFDEKMLPYCLLLPGGHERKQTDDWFTEAWRTSMAGIMAGFLAQAGYWERQELRGFVVQRLRTKRKRVEKRVFNFFLKPKDLAGLPKAWQGKPVLRHELVREFPLPDATDFATWASMPADMLTPANRRMIDGILNYVLDPRIQSLPETHYVWDKGRHQCFSGVNHAVLPGWRGVSNAGSKQAKYILPYLATMAHLHVMSESRWFAGWMDYFEQFRTAEGTYRIPGKHHEMSLGENRKTRLGSEIESTFRMLSIRKLAGMP